MKLFVILTVIASGYAEKLDRTYLPPPNAVSAGGSPGSLIAPSGSASGFGQSAPSGNFGSPAQGAFAGSSRPSVFGQPGNIASSKSAYGQQQIQPQGGLNQPGFGRPSQGFDQGSTPNLISLGAPQGYYQNAGPRGSDNFAPANQPERPQAAADRSAEILKYVNENDGETFNYSFETSNGISAEENGVATNGVQAQGGFSYVGDDGQKYSVTYTADENGYVPQGEHLPTPHPIPEEILISIEKNAQAAAAGTQEGAYNPEEDNDSGPSPQQYNSPSAFGQQPSGPSQQYGAPAPSFKQTPQQSFNQGPSASSSSRPGPAQSAFAPTNLAQSSFSQTGPAQSPFVPVGSATRPAPGSQSNQYNRPQSATFRQPAPQNTFGSQQQDESGYQYNRPSVPQTSFRGSAKAGASPSQGSFTPSGNGAPKASFAAQPSPAYRNSPAPQDSFGGRPTSTAQGSFNRQPSSPQQINPTPKNSFQAGSQQFNGQQPAAPRSSMPQYQSAPYQYDQPKPQQAQSNSRPGTPSQPGSQQPSGPFNPLATQTFNQAGQGQAAQGQGQKFGAPRQPPSFSPEEGYKY